MTTTTSRPLKIYSAISLFLLCLPLCTATVGHCSSESKVSTAPRKLIAAIPADLPPTYFLDKSGKPAGFAVDVMNELARKTDMTVEYVSGQTFDDVIQMVLTGKADLIPSLTIDERRKKLIAFTDTVGFLPANLFVASGNLTVQGISPGLTIGVVKGSTPESFLMKNQTIRISTFANPQTMLFELLAGHVDGIVFLTPNLMKLAIDAGVDDKIKVVGKPIIEAKRGIALRKEDTALLTHLNKAIGEFIDSPEYRQIYVKWYGKPKPYWTGGRIGAVSGILLILIVCGMAFWRYRSIVRLNNRLALSIAEYKQVEGALRENEIKLQAIFDTVGTGIVMIDRDTQIIMEANQTAIEMTGLSKEGLIGQICHSVVCPAQAGKCPVKDLGQRVDHSERKMRYADGHLKDILKTVYPVTIKGRDCYLESFMDISERKRIEDELRESESRFRSLFEQAAVGVGEIEMSTGRFLTVNGRLCEMVGRTEEELLATTFQAITHPEDLHLHKEQTALLLTGKIGHYSLEKRYLRKDGEIVWVNIEVSLLWKPGEKPGRNMIVVEDITERKQAEEALRESEERYRTLVENASDIVFRLDDTGHVTFVNPAALRIMGYEEKEIIGRHYPTFIRSDMQEEAMKFFGRQFVKGIPNTYSEYPIIMKDGREIWLGQNTQLIFQDGKVIAFQAVARDVTARKQVEEELRRNHNVTERLAQEIAIIAEIGKVIGSTLDTEKIYERFAAEVRKLIPFDRLSVNLHDLDRGIVSTVYVFGEYVANRQQGDSFPLKGSVSEVLVKTKVGMFSHPLSVEEMDKRFPYHTATIQAGMRSLIGIPLISRDKVIASLHFRSRKPNAYTEQDLRMAERIGEQIAGAIANAQLYAGLKKTEQELKESEQRYRELSIVDDLTQLYNYRHFYFQLKIELDRSNRYEQPLTLLLLDLDNFKAFNDAYGHVEGDQVLRRLGQVVKRCLRETDFAYRYGGEEFTILLPMTTSADGAVTAERIRTEFKKEIFSPAPGQDVHVTVSIGLAQYKPQEEMKVFIHRVDQLMYQGKKGGKNRVCFEP